MRALLTPEIAPRLGVVLFRPGTEVMRLFRQGRVLIGSVPKELRSLPSGQVPAAVQTLSDDPALRPFFINESVINAAGGMNGLECWLMRQKKDGCQWPCGDYHHHEIVTQRHTPGAIRLCWSCDNKLRDQTTEQIEDLAVKNLCVWAVEQIRLAMRFDDSHVLTLPELCWWAFTKDVTAALPESIARRALGMPTAPELRSVMKESDIVPDCPPATSIIQAHSKDAGELSKRWSNENQQEEIKPILQLTVDSESPESFMLRPKRRRWVCEKYIRWVKQQPCACCGSPADDPHHVIGYGLSGMGTKAHDLFVIPLCRKHHDELHRDPVAFEKKYGSQPEMAVRTLDRALAIGVIA